MSFSTFFKAEKVKISNTPENIDKKNAKSVREVSEIRIPH